MDFSRQELDGQLNRLTRRDMTRENLLDLNANDGFRSLDESHNRGDGKRCHPGALAQSDVGHITIGRRSHDSCIEVPLGRVELRLNRIKLSLTLLQSCKCSSLSLFKLARALQVDLSKL